MEGGLGSPGSHPDARRDRHTRPHLLAFRFRQIVFGTDALAGSHGRNFEELLYRVEQGHQDPMAAIVSATSLAAESLGLQNEIGTVAPGFEADLIAVEGDPLQDIRALKKAVWVMKAGKVVRNDRRGK